MIATFYVKALQLIVGVCMALLLAKPIDLCSERVFDKLLFNKSSTCHHPAIFFSRTLQVPCITDNSTSVANDTSLSNDKHIQLTNMVVVSGELNISKSNSTSLSKCSPQLTTKMCWTLGFRERFCFYEADNCVGLSTLLVALFIITLAVFITLLQIVVMMWSMEPPSGLEMCCWSFQIAMFWLVAAVEMTVLCTIWQDKWHKRQLDPAFPREWLVVLMLSWSMLLLETAVALFGGKALNVHVRFERLAGYYHLDKKDEQRNADATDR